MPYFCNSLSAPKLDLGGSLKGKEARSNFGFNSKCISLKHLTQKRNHYALALYLMERNWHFQNRKYLDKTLRIFPNCLNNVPKFAWNRSWSKYLLKLDFVNPIASLVI